MPDSNSFTRSDALGYDLDAASRLGNSPLRPGLDSDRRFAATSHVAIHSHVLTPGFLVTCSVVCPERPIVPQKTVCYQEQRCRALSFFCLY